MAFLTRRNLPAASTDVIRRHRHGPMREIADRAAAH